MQKQQWVVVLRDQRTNGRFRDPMLYGPLDDERVAAHLADWFSTQVDPAIALPLHDPIAAALDFADHLYHKGPEAGVDVIDHWPPQPGDIWQDKYGRRWSCQHPAAFGSWAAKTSSPYLVCLAEMGDDPAEEINKLFGPLVLVYRPEPRESEVPF